MSLVDREAVMEIILVPQNVSIIEQLEMLKKLSSAEPKWILISEQLPKKTAEYLVCYNNGDVSTSWYGFTDDGLIDGFDEDIIAWMPLPKRYQEKDE